MISYLASPKPFIGLAKEQQYRAIRSWLSTNKNAEVLLYGDVAGATEASRDLGVRVVRNIACAPSGIPYFGAIAAHAAEHAVHDRQVYVNCDIMLFGIEAAMARMSWPRFVLVGQRIDLAMGVVLDVAASDWRASLHRFHEERKAKLHSVTGKDYFGFRRGLWRDLPEVIIGRGGYDTALLAHCIRHNIPIIDATRVALAIHHFHDYGHVKGGVDAVMRGPEASRNIIVAGGAHGSLTIADADYALTDVRREPEVRRRDALRQLELHLRFKRHWWRLALFTRLLWRVLSTIGLVRVAEPTLRDVLSKPLQER